MLIGNHWTRASYKISNAIKLSKCKIAGFYKNKERIEYFKENFDNKNNFCFNNYEDLLNSKDIDIVILYPIHYILNGYLDV